MSARGWTPAAKETGVWGRDDGVEVAFVVVVGEGGVGRRRDETRRRVSFFSRR